MGTREVASRLAAGARHAAWRRRRVWPEQWPLVTPPQQWVFPRGLSFDDERERTIGRADDYLKGDYTFLSIRSGPPHHDWWADPGTAISAPRCFGPTMDYRDPSAVGNYRTTWEKNRLQHLTVLACAYWLTRDERYATEVFAQLRSWLEQNPFPVGINWASPLEASLRLVSMVWLYRLLNGAPAFEDFFGPHGLMWPTIHSHQWYVACDRSVGSSANNHLIGEMAGLFVASHCWPVFKESRKWVQLSRSILEREAVAQTFESGLNREQAFGYHLFVLELLTIAGLEAERHGAPLSQRYRRTVRAMAEAASTLIDEAGNLPRYGDSDGGRAILLQPSPSSIGWVFCAARTWLAASLPRPPAAIAEGSLTASLVFPRPLPAMAEAAQPVASGSIAFREAGVFLLVARGTAGLLRCLVDAGPFGYLSTAAHAHADALSFTLSVGGVPIIVDPGTYAYHSDPKLRAYFRGTAAHNTVVVDGADQAVSGGVFLWTRKADARHLDWRPSDDGGSITAEHGGYGRLPEPVLHRRKVSLHGAELVVLDELTGRGVHDLEWRFHFAPECRVGLADHHLEVSWRGGRLTADLDEAASWKLARGGRSAGVYSPSFNVIESTTTLIGRISGPPPQRVRTSIVLRDHAEPAE